MARPTDATHMRSDNDWLVFNLEAAEQGIASVIEQAEMGRFSRLLIKKGTLDMNDALYGVFRTFTDITLDIAPTPNGKAVEGSFSANFGGTVMKGIFERVDRRAGEARLKVILTNFDLSSFVPNINDTASMVGIIGAAAVSLDIGFDADDRQDQGRRLPHRHDRHRSADRATTISRSPATSSRWTGSPTTGTFTMDESALTIGTTSAKVSGVFVLGLDDLYGPTVGISMTGHDVTHPVANDMARPPTVFDTVSFKGWSAPLYGAVGIDQAIMTKGDGSASRARAASTCCARASAST